MLGVLKSIYLLALIVWIGEIVFFSFVGAPAVFGALESPEAGRVVGTIFPTYYRIGYVCGALMLATGVVLLGQLTDRGWWTVSSAIAALMLGATLYAGLAIQPRATALRPQLHDATLAATVKPEFDRLHRLAVMLNGAVLIGGVIVSVITARSIR